MHVFSRRVTERIHVDVVFLVNILQLYSPGPFAAITTSLFEARRRKCARIILAIESLWLRKQENVKMAKLKNS